MYRLIAQLSRVIPLMTVTSRRALFHPLTTELKIEGEYRATNVHDGLSGPVINI